MATDATGTPTSLGIPTFLVGVDAPTGNGSNAQMTQIDALLQARNSNLTLGNGVAASTGLFFSKPAAYTDSVFASLPGNNGPNNYFQIRGDGLMQWGPGAAAAVDSDLFRSGVGVMKSNSTFEIVGSLYAAWDGSQWGVQLGGHTDGLIFGGDASSNLYRPSAGVVKTDGVFNAVGGLQINGVAVGTSTQMAYNEFTTTVGVTATTEATAQTVVTASAFTADGTSSYLIEFYAPGIQPTNTANASLTTALFDGATSQGTIGDTFNPAAGLMRVPGYMARKVVPSAGSHTYSIRGYVSSGTGNYVVGVGGAGVDLPGFIRISKVA